MSLQLTTDGREVALVSGGRRFGKTLSIAQREVLALLGKQGVVRSVEAGVILHRLRGHCGCGAKTDRARKYRRASAIECCPYAAADGLEVLKRLQRHGYVRRTFLHGRWVQP